jgi:zinc protease
MNVFGRLLACLSLAVATAAAGAAPQTIFSPTGAVQVRRTIIADPAVRSGVLPNGMRYFITRAALPVGGLSLRLGFDVGSFEERDDERGFAHFVEHLAFRQTRSAPDGGLDARFAKLGVGFGRDLNATTTQFATTYQLDFNAANAAATTEGFRWLRDVADGVIFTDAGIRSEHGVVISEETVRKDEAERISQAVARFRGPELRTTVRNPGALAPALSSIKADAVRAYYERWYRPENAVLVVVGDRPVAELEKLVTDHFATWRGNGSPSRRARLGKVNVARGLDAIAVAAPTLPKAVTACRMQPPPAPDVDELSRIIRETRRSIWQGIFDQRIGRLVNAGTSSLLSGGVMDDSNQEYSSTCLVAIPTGDNWPKALAAVQSELTRLATDGPTATELESQIEEQRSRLRGAVSNAGARTASNLAEMILERGLERHVVMSPAEEMRVYNVAVEDLDVPTLKAAVKADWSGSGPLLTLLLPTKAPAAAVKAAWLKTQAGGPLPAYTDLAAVKWPYEDFGPAGAVVSKEHIARPGFTRVRFANGVVLNFKQWTAQPNEVEVRAQFGAGRKQIANEDYATAEFGTGMLIPGGLGRISGPDIERAMRNVSWQFDFGMRSSAFEFSQSSVAANLPSMLQVFAAFLSDPGFRSDSDARIPDAIDIVFRNLLSEPDVALDQAMTAAIDPKNPELMPSQEKLAKLNSREFARVLKGPITTEAIEVTVVGDVDEEMAINLVSRTFGALKPGRKVTAPRADARFLQIPDRPYPVIRTTHKGAVDRAATRLMWPLYVATPARRREEYALDLLAAVFQDALRQRIRYELGKTYDPTVDTIMPDFADQGVLSADFSSQPGDVDTLIKEAQSLAQKLASGDISAEQVEAVRQPLLTSFAARRNHRSWWAAALSGSAKNPESINELMDYDVLMKAITADEVKAAARKWLVGKPIIGIALPESVAKAATGRVSR